MTQKKKVMKRSLKLKIISKVMILFLLSFFLFAAEAGAGYYSFQPDPSDLFDLDHSNYYKWGIGAAASYPSPYPSPEEINKIYAARLIIDNIWDSQSGTNYLRVHLIDDPYYLGVTTFSDSNEGGDYFPVSTLLKEWSDITHYQSQARDLRYDFTPDNLNILISFMKTNNKFGLGFDPDCHFYNNGVK